MFVLLEAFTKCKDCVDYSFVKFCMFGSVESPIKPIKNMTALNYSINIHQRKAFEKKFFKKVIRKATISHILKNFLNSKSSSICKSTYMANILLNSVFSSCGKRFAEGTEIEVPKR